MVLTILKEPKVDLNKNKILLSLKSISKIYHIAFKGMSAEGKAAL